MSVKQDVVNNEWKGPPQKVETGQELDFFLFGQGMMCYNILEKKSERCCEWMHASGRKPCLS